MKYKSYYETFLINHDNLLQIDSHIKLHPHLVQSTRTRHNVRNLCKTWEENVQPEVV